MKKVEYEALKKSMILEFGADTPELLIYHANGLKKPYFKWLSISFFIICIPLGLWGIQFLVLSVVTYIFYRKQVKKANSFIDFVKSDSEFKANQS